MKEIQGELKVLDKLLSLEEEIRQYNKDILAGKVKPKGEYNEMGIKV